MKTFDLALAKFGLAIQGCRTEWHASSSFSLNNRFWDNIQFEGSMNKLGIQVSIRYIPQYANAFPATKYLTRKTTIKNWTLNADQRQAVKYWLKHVKECRRVDENSQQHARRRAIHQALEARRDFISGCAS